MSDIVKGGVVESDGRLMQGDQILSVNKEDVRNATQELVAELLKVSLYRNHGKSHLGQIKPDPRYIFAILLDTYTLP